MFNFKKSRKSNSFQTTSEQFTLMDYINPITNKINPKYKILRLFRQNFKIRWTRNLISKPKTITISFKNNKWSISFSQQMEIKQSKRIRKSLKTKIKLSKRYYKEQIKRKRN